MGRPTTRTLTLERTLIQALHSSLMGTFVCNRHIFPQLDASSDHLEIDAVEALDRCTLALLARSVSRYRAWRSTSKKKV